MIINFNIPGKINVEFYQLENIYRVCHFSRGCEHAFSDVMIYIRNCII